LLASFDGPHTYTATVKSSFGRAAWARSTMPGNAVAIGGGFDDDCGPLVCFAIAWSIVSWNQDSSEAPGIIHSRKTSRVFNDGGPSGRQ
ncbi:hypothetical protein PBRA_001275, partial [Plasmodiophora brassicae]